MLAQPSRHFVRIGSLSLWHSAKFAIARATLSWLWACRSALVVARCWFSLLGKEILWVLWKVLPRGSHNSLHHPIQVLNRRSCGDCSEILSKSFALVHTFPATWPCTRWELRLRALRPIVWLCSAMDLVAALQLHYSFREALQLVKKKKSMFCRGTAWASLLYFSSPHCLESLAGAIYFNSKLWTNARIVGRLVSLQFVRPAVGFFKVSFDSVNEPMERQGD